jgi:hypothetical protein
MLNNRDKDKPVFPHVNPKAGNFRLGILPSEKALINSFQ